MSVERRISKQTFTEASLPVIFEKPAIKKLCEFTPQPSVHILPQMMDIACFGTRTRVCWKQFLVLLSQLSPLVPSLCNEGKNIGREL
jgi:hypothetical protein